MASMNAIDEFQNALGFLYPFAMIGGVVGMFGAPILGFLSAKGYFLGGPSNRRAGSLFLTAGSIVSVLAAIVWIFAVLAIFPGLFFCGVYCFLGYALPLLGISMIIATMLLIVGSRLNKWE